MHRAHRVVGWLTFVLFLGTGFYLHFRAEGLARGDASVHFSLRANHIYILMGALLNLAMSRVDVAPSGSWRRWVRIVGRWLVLAAPAVLIAAFVVEGPRPALDIFQRPLTVAGVFGLVLGTLGAVAGTRVRAGGEFTPTRS